MLVQREISADEVVGVHKIESDLPESRTYREFRPPRPVDVARAYPTVNATLLLLPVYKRVVNSVLNVLEMKYVLHNCGVSKFLHVMKFGGEHHEWHAAIKYVPSNGIYPRFGK